MHRKKTIFVVSIIIIGVLGLFLFSTLAFFKADVYPNLNKQLIVRKIKNPNIHFNIFKPSASKVLKIGDLILYKNPLLFDIKFKEKPNYCSRIIGLPGDIITIKESKVFVNDIELETNFDIWFLYRVSCINEENFEELLEGYQAEIVELLNNGKACNIITTNTTAKKIQNIDGVVNVRKILVDKAYNDPYMFSSKGNTPLWNMDNLGPISVPEIDVTVFLKPKNIGIYFYLIDIHEENNLNFDINSIKINGEKANSYIIKQNYYFVLNDNRYNPKDSRTWGFIPEDQIIGKVINL